MANQCDTVEAWGEFVPLLGLGNEQPPAKSLVYSSKDGITYVRDPTTDQTVSSEDPSGSAVKPAYAPTPCIPQPTIASGTSTMPTLQTQTTAHAPMENQATAASTSTDPEIAYQGVSATRPATRSPRQEPATTEDHHAALQRASMPSPTDQIAVERFFADTTRRKAKLQQRMIELRQTKAARAAKHKHAS